MSSATVKLSAPSGIHFRCSEVSSDHGKSFVDTPRSLLMIKSTDVRLDTSDDAFVLRDLNKEQSVTVAVPHSDASSFHFVVSTSP